MAHARNIAFVNIFWATNEHRTLLTPIALLNAQSINEILPKRVDKDCNFTPVFRVRVTMHYVVFVT